jgi:uncharacterized protein YukE
MKPLYETYHTAITNAVKKSLSEDLSASETYHKENFHYMNDEYGRKISYKYFQKLFYKERMNIMEEKPYYEDFINYDKIDSDKLSIEVNKKIINTIKELEEINEQIESEECTLRVLNEEFEIKMKKWKDAITDTELELDDLKDQLKTILRDLKLLIDKCGV